MGGEKHFYVTFKGGVGEEGTSMIGIVYGDSSIPSSKGQDLFEAVRGCYTLYKRSEKVSFRGETLFMEYVEVEGYSTLVPYEGVVKELFEKDPGIKDNVDEIGDILMSLGTPDYNRARRRRESRLHKQDLRPLVTGGEELELDTTHLRIPELEIPRTKDGHPIH